MIKKRFLVFVVCIFACLSISGCSSGQGDGIAATFNGQGISEQSVTDYIQSTRLSLDCEDDKDWAQWLVDYDYTPEDMRDEGISFYENVFAIADLAAQRGIEVTDEEVDKEVADYQEMLGVSDEEFEKQLKSEGYISLDYYRQNTREMLLESRLYEAINEEIAFSDDDVVAKANEYFDLAGATSIKHVSILEADADKKAELENVRKTAVENNADFLDAVGENENVWAFDGWIPLDLTDDEYIEAASKLKPGEISEIIEGVEGLFVLKVEEETTLPEGKFTSVDQLPETIRDQMVSEVQNSYMEETFYDSIDAAVNDAEVTKNPMPKGLPYDVDLSGLTPSIDTDDYPYEDDGIIGGDLDFSSEDFGNAEFGSPSSLDDTAAV